MEKTDKKLTARVLESESENSVYKHRLKTRYIHGKEIHQG